MRYQVVAQDFFRHHLQPELARAIDLDSLRLLETSYINEELAKSFSDLVYEARLQNSDIKLALLIEHQSTPDPWMPVRLLEYWAGYLSNQRKGHPGQKIPAAYLMPFYHGEQTPYPWAVEFNQILWVLLPDIFCQ